MSAKWERSGRTRLTMVSRLFRCPLIGLEVEWEDRSYYNNYPTTWNPAGVESLTVIKGLFNTNPSANIRYRAHKAGLLRQVWLVMQICINQETDVWRDAKVEDLGDLGHKDESAKARK